MHNHLFLLLQYSLMWRGGGLERWTCHRDVSSSTPGRSTFM